MLYVKNVFDILYVLYARLKKRSYYGMAMSVCPILFSALLFATGRTMDWTFCIYM